MEDLTLGLVDDHPALLRGVLVGLDDVIPATVHALLASTVDELLENAGHLDAVLLDVELNDGSDPAENVGALISRGWPVLLYTQEGRRGVVARCLLAGATGIVGKHRSLDVLAEAVLTIAAGEPYFSPEWAAVVEDAGDWGVPALTPREEEALRLYATGLPLKSVARRMGITPDTAKEHLDRVRRKYETAGRPTTTKTDLLVRALEDGLINNPAVTRFRQ